MVDLPKENEENQSGDNSERDLMPTLHPGMKFTGVIDGEVPGGYLITIRGGNGLDLQGKAFFSSHMPTQIEASANANVPRASTTNVDLTHENHNQNLNQETERDHLENTWNQESCSSFGVNRTPLEFEIDDDLDSDYSDFEMPPSPGPDVPDALLVTNKFAPIGLKQVNPLTGMPIDQTKSLDKGKQIAKDYCTPNPKDYKIGVDPFLPRKFPSPAISISPPRDGVRKQNLSAQTLVGEQCARLTQPDSLSLNRNTSQHALLRNNEKVVHCQPTGIRKRNVSTEILDTEQYARVSHLGSSPLNQNTSQVSLLNNNEKFVHLTGIRKRNVSSEIFGTGKYARLSHPGSSFPNRNTSQDALLNNNEKFVHSTSIRKRNVSAEIFGTRKYARLSHLGSSSFNRNINQDSLLNNNEKFVHSADIRKRNVSAETFGTGKYARLSHPGSLSFNRNPRQDALLNNEKFVHSADIRKRNVSTEIFGTEKYARLSHLSSSSFNRNTSQDALLNSNEKFVHSTGIRKRNFSTEIFGNEKYARLSHQGSSSLNGNPSQHALLKNNEKAVQCQPASSNLTDMVNSFFAASHQKRLMIKHVSGEEGSSTEQQGNKCFIDLEEEKDDDNDDDDTQTNSTS